MVSESIFVCEVESGVGERFYFFFLFSFFLFFCSVREPVRGRGSGY